MIIELNLSNNYFHISGRISIAEWCEAMQAGTGLAVPWRLLRDRVLSPEAAESASKTGLVTYSETFCGPGRVCGFSDLLESCSLIPVPRQIA